MSNHILIVEDTRSLGDSISDMLNMEGFTVSLVLNGEDAVDFLQTVIPDLIITDLLMPGMSGFDLIRYIRNHKPFTQIPIILLTAQIGEENRSAALNAGANAFLEKPFDEEDLLRSINLLLGK